jgi:hypothetical protein
MANFLLSILASIVAGVILIWAAGLISKQARWVLIGILGRLLNLDVDYVFTNKTEVQSDLKKELSRSNDVAIFTGRGNELQRRTFSALFLERPEKRQVRVRILLPRTIQRDGEYDWTLQRENELAKFDPAFGNGLLKEQIQVIIRFFQQHLSAKTVEVRQFNYSHIGRIVITERFAYYTPYRKDAHGSNSPVYKFRRSGEMYDNFLRLFEQLWNASKDEEAASSHDNSCKPTTR